MSTVGGSWSRPKIVNDGLVLYLDASAPNSYSPYFTPTTWKDLSGNNNSGSLVNGPTFNSANGGSIVFDGVNDYVLVPSSASIPTGSSARSISLWFSTNTSTWTKDINTLFFYGSGTNGRAFGIDFDTYPVMEVFTWGGTGRDLLFSSSFSQTGWKNLSITYNGSTTILIYENGTYTQTLALTLACNTTTSNVYIGAINPAVLAGGYFTGSITQTSIYNRALTAAEVLQNYNATKNRFGL
jgi:hypothetical protein